MLVLIVDVVIVCRCWCAWRIHWLCFVSYFIASAISVRLADAQRRNHSRVSVHSLIWDQCHGAFVSAMIYVM